MPPQTVEYKIRLKMETAISSRAFRPDETGRKGTMKEKRENKEKIPASVYDPYGHPEAIRIEEDGRTSDMNPHTVMSGDGCNPLSQDEELSRAHDQDSLLFPSSLPGIPGSFTGTVPPAYFPGAGTDPWNVI